MSKLQSKVRLSHDEMDPYKKERKKAGAKNQKQFARFQEKKKAQKRSTNAKPRNIFLSVGVLRKGNLFFWVLLYCLCSPL